MRRIMLVFLEKLQIKKTSIFHQIKKRNVTFKKMMAVDVSVDQLFLKFLLALFLIILPYTGIMMFLYFVQ